MASKNTTQKVAAPDTQISLRVDPELKEQVVRRAKLEYRSISKVVERAIRAYLKTEPV